MSAQVPAPASGFPPRRVFYWSVRRELWEHRYVYLAPAALAAFVVLAHFLSAVFIPDADRAATLADPKKAHEFMSLYGAASFAILATGFIVGAVYALGALNGERRDRSILFWKSLPVSDRMTVLAKASIPIVLIPTLVFALIVAANLIMLVLQSAEWAVDGFDPRQLWARLDLPFMWLCLLYGLPFMALWYAPLYAWMLLISAWVRHAAFLWALAPLIAISILQYLVIRHTGMGATLLERRVGGAVREAFTVGGGGKVWIDKLADLDPLRLYTLPELWGGLLVAAIFLFLAIRLRRSRGPL
jgi:ABC-2 type transport system permease protein